MIIKKKSLIVAFVSGVVVSMVLILSLCGLLIYVELKGEDARISYKEAFYRHQISGYIKHLDVIRLESRIGQVGIFKGKPIIEGEIINKGKRDIKGILLKIRFVDNDGAGIYEVIFRPDEPALGVSSLSHVSMPHRSSSKSTVLSRNGSLPFKKIVAGLPQEILGALQGNKNFSKESFRWKGRLTYEIISLDF